MSVVLASFFFWRELKEDISNEEIFKATLLILFFSFCFSKLFYILFRLDELGFSLKPMLSFFSLSGLSFFGAFSGAVLALAWYFQRLKRSIWEGLDALSLPLLLFVSLLGIGSFLSKGEPEKLIFLGVGISGFIVLKLIKKKYRSFSWYKSGKTGFMFWSTVLWVFTLSLVLDFVLGVTLYWEELFWFALVLFSVGVIFYRSERDIKEDFRNLIKRRRK